MARPDFDIVPGAVATIRRIRDKSQRVLATESRTSVGTIARIETGTLKPSWFTLLSIAKALDVSPDAIALIRTRPAEATAGAA